MKVQRPREEIGDHHHPNLEPGRGHWLQVSPVLSVSHLLDLTLLIEDFAGTKVFYRETMRGSTLLVGFIIGRAMPWQSLLHSTAAVRPDGIKTEFSYLHHHHTTRPTTPSLLFPSELSRPFLCIFPSAGKLQRTLHDYEIFHRPSSGGLGARWMWSRCWFHLIKDTSFSKTTEKTSQLNIIIRSSDTD